MLGVFSPPCDDSPCRVEPYITKLTGPSANWAWTSWNNNSGSFYLYNAQNGSGYRLDSITGFTSQPHGDDAQRLSLSSIEAINDNS